MLSDTKSRRSLPGGALGGTLGNFLQITSLLVYLQDALLDFPFLNEQVELDKKRTPVDPDDGTVGDG